MATLYNLIHGMTPAVVFILPLLGDKKPDQYPRFRDCFTSDLQRPDLVGCIMVYTRVGGANRGCGYGEVELMQHPNFLETYDDEADSTYGMYVFSVPHEWKEDYDKASRGYYAHMSVAAQQRIRAAHPGLAAQFDRLWGVEELGDAVAE